jgi:hypothetical protein
MTERYAVMLVLRTLLGEGVRTDKLDIKARCKVWDIHHALPLYRARIFSDNTSLFPSQVGLLDTDRTSSSLLTSLGDERLGQGEHRPSGRQREQSV